MQVSYRKVRGVLAIVDAARVTWSPSVPTNLEGLDLPVRDIESMFASKPDSPRVMLKITLKDERSFTFTFVDAPSAVSDRERTKTELARLMSGLRQARPASPAAAAASSADHIKAIKKHILMNNPALASLHRSLVVGPSAVLAESDFWIGREQLIEAARAELEQKKGRTGDMVDPKPETSASGDVTVKVTNTLIKEIFEEYPQVLRAYSENVPERLDDQEFWTRYFQSKLFNRYRSTNRAAVNTIKDDPIFDRYLDKEDDEIEPRRAFTQKISSLLNLSATEDDQRENENQKDVTMRAGGQKSSLPLMRRFNEHSERLLNQALEVDGEAGEVQRPTLETEIVLEDLESHASEKDTLLTIDVDPQMIIGARRNIDESETNEGLEQEKETLKRVQTELSSWEPDLAEFKVNPTATSNGMSEMIENVRLKTYKPKSHEIMSEAVEKRITTLHLATTELLRQFWGIILEVHDPNKLSESQQRVTKMINFIKKSFTDMQNLIKVTDDAVEKYAIEQALSPVMKGAATAISMYDTANRR